MEPLKPSEMRRYFQFREKTQDSKQAEKNQTQDEVPHLPSLEDVKTPPPTSGSRCTYTYC